MPLTRHCIPYLFFECNALRLLSLGPPAACDNRTHLHSSRPNYPFDSYQPSSLAACGLHALRHCTCGIPQIKVPATPQASIGRGLAFGTMSEKLMDMSRRGPNAVPGAGAGKVLIKRHCSTSGERGEHSSGPAEVDRPPCLPRGALPHCGRVSHPLPPSCSFACSGTSSALEKQLWLCTYVYTSIRRRQVGFRVVLQSTCMYKVLDGRNRRSGPNSTDLVL